KGRDRSSRALGPAPALLLALRAELALRPARRDPDRPLRNPNQRARARQVPLEPPLLLLQLAQAVLGTGPLALRTRLESLHQPLECTGLQHVVAHRRDPKSLAPFGRAPHAAEHLEDHRRRLARAFASADRP